MREILKSKEITELSVEKLNTFIKRSNVSKDDFDRFSLCLTLPIGGGLEPSFLFPLYKYFIESEYQPIYINEVKETLRKHNIEMYNQYVSQFDRISGCIEAFGITSDKRTPYVREKVRCEMRLLEPCFKMSTNRKKMGCVENKRLRRRAREEAFEKLVRRKARDEEYKEKVKKMYSKILGNN
jgi:hypothetical protein